MSINNSQKKKILYVITKGAQRYVYDLATGLPKDKFETVVTCGDQDGDTLQRLLNEKGVRVIKIGNLGREINFANDFKVLKNLIKIIKEEKPNMVHLNSSKIGFLGTLASLYFKFFFIIQNSKFKIHFIFTVHGWAFNEKDRATFSKLIYYLAHYLTILICDQTIAVSKKAKKDMKIFPFIKNKIKVIYNGIALSDLISSPTDNKLLKGKNKTIIFSIAELHKNKGIDIAFQAISLLPKEIQNKIIYYIVGAGEERENLEKMATNMGISRIIKLLGFIPDVKKLLSANNIFLLPSRTEAFPYAILEAGVAGMPIIATNVGGIPEIINDMQNGILVPPQNPKEIAEAILYLLDHKDKQEEFGRKIKNTVSRFFSLKKMLKETIKLYQ